MRILQVEGAKFAFSAIFCIFILQFLQEKNMIKKTKPAKREAERAKEHSLPTQALFVSKLREMIPSSISLADELADLLGISTDSAYRRLRCETEIGIDELHKISSKYGISIDSVFANKGDTATFQYISLAENALNFEKYLENIAGHLKRVNGFEHKQIIYAAEEVPVFHSFNSRVLSAFKMFYWQRSVLNVPELQTKKFEIDILSDTLFETGQRIHKLYSTIPSIEIWTDETILTVIKQLEFYVESGVFKNKEDALEIADAIASKIENIKQCAENSTKVPGLEKNYQLYKSDVVIGTNCIHVDIGETNYSFISFNTLNSLTTSNAAFCKETEHWMENLIKKSTLISGTAEKQRYQFFNKMVKQIDSSREKIQNTL